jgi:hypothetical protein
VSAWLSRDGSSTGRLLETRLKRAGRLVWRVAALLRHHRIAQLHWQYCAERLISRRAPDTADASGQICTSRGLRPFLGILHQGFLTDGYRFTGFRFRGLGCRSLRSRVRSEVLDTNDLWTVAVAWEHGLTFLTTDKMPCIRESIQEGIKNRSNSPSHRLSETSRDLPES